MLAQLKFVMGAVSKKDLVPAMTHFAIANGRVRAFNGMVALSSPIPFDIVCNPKGETLYRAIENCDESVSLYLTPTGKLGVKSGKFRALVPCIEETTLLPEPEGELLHIDGEALVKAFKVLEPFIGDDASRPWQAGILLKGGSAFATCNVVLVQYWLGADLGRVLNVPGGAVREILRVGELPTHAQCTDTSITFHFSSGRWIRTQLLPTDWPDLARILDKECNPTPIDESIFVALDKLKKLVDKSGRVYFEAGIVRTHEDENEGSQFAIADSSIRGIFALDMLKLLNGVAKQIDFTDCQQACVFYGDMLRGAIIGMRM